MAMTSTPNRCNSITTSFPSSPEPQKRTRVALGLRGVPIRTVFSLTVIPACILFMSDLILLLTFRYFLQYFTTLIIGHRDPAKYFVASTLTPDANVALIQSTHRYTGRANPIANLRH